MSVRVELIAADTDSVTSSITGTQHGHGFTPVLRLLLWTPVSPCHRVVQRDFSWRVLWIVRLGPVLLSPVTGVTPAPCFVLR